MKFARMNIRAKKPTRKYPTDAGLDLYALDMTIIRPGEMKTVNTGIAIELPEGTMGLIKPKSRHSRLVGAGVIDEGYRGEIKVRVFNPHHKNIYIKHHDPVAQLIVIPVLTSDMELVPYDKLKNTKRGKSGGING